MHEDSKNNLVSLSECIAEQGQRSIVKVEHLFIPTKSGRMEEIK